MKKHLIVLLSLVIALQLKGQSYSPIIFDKQLSQNFGAYNLIAAHRAFYLFEDKHIRDTLFKENNALKKTAGIGYRLAKLLVLDAQVDCFTALLQHEAFGHGARYRELGYTKNSFNLNLYFPFGDGSGFSQRGTLQTGYKYPTSQENITTTIGGVDAEMLLAGNLGNQLLLDDTIHYRNGLLYLIAQNNLPLYLWSTRYTQPKNIKPSNDMMAYMSQINYLYPHAPNKIYDINTLSNQSLISLANPLQVYSAFSIVYSYLIKGEKQMKKIPMIKFGQVRYLPALAYSFTPFGSQYHFINYIRYKHVLFNADFNMGESTFTNFYGLSIKGFNVVDNKRVTLNFHVDVWNQPELDLDNYLQLSTIDKMGGAIKVDFMLRPFVRQNKIGLFVQTGYKTKGYVTGEVLAESFILRYGISMHL